MLRPTILCLGALLAACASQGGRQPAQSDEDFAFPGQRLTEVQRRALPEQLRAQSTEAHPHPSPDRPSFLCQKILASDGAHLIQPKLPNGFAVDDAAFLLRYDFPEREAHVKLVLLSKSPYQNADRSPLWFLQSREQNFVLSILGPLAAASYDDDEQIVSIRENVAPFAQHSYRLTHDLEREIVQLESFSRPLLGLRQSKGTLKLECRKL